MTTHLEAGSVRAIVDADRGGRLASLVIRGRERLITRPMADAAVPEITWGSFPMVPWVGRIREGRLSWEGQAFDLPRNLGGHAIHGTAFDRPWVIEGSDDRRAVMRCRLGGGDGWPFAAEVTQVVDLSPASISFRLEVTADEAMPVALGWHPWFAREGREPIRVTVPSAEVLVTMPDLIPTGARIPVDDLTDLRAGPVIGDRALDHAYVGIAGPSLIAWPDQELTMEADPLASIVVHSTPRGICVEPQTAWPDAVRLAERGAATGIVTLGPHEALSASCRWTWRGSAAPGRT
jgi:aldose 1-epimerase